MLKSSTDIDSYIINTVLMYELIVYNSLNVFIAKEPNMHIAKKF